MIISHLSPCGQTVLIQLRWNLTLNMEKKQYLLPFAHAGQVLTEQASDVAKAEHLKSKTILESAKNSQGPDVIW